MATDGAFLNEDEANNNLNKRCKHDMCLIVLFSNFLNTMR